MQTVLIVFLIGSAASFLPIYWLLSSLTSRRSPSKGKLRLGANAKTRFMHCLRAEAIDRTNELMIALEKDARGRAAAARGASQSFDAKLIARAHEARAMIEAILPGDTLTAFDELVDNIETPSTDLQALARQIQAVKRSMLEGAKTQVPSQSQRLSRRGPLLLRQMFAAPCSAPARGAH